jgi:ubiquinone/menaquinone biosynthesis C-methylase UbiE
MREGRFRGELLAQLLDGTGGQPLDVLDLGAGTGTLAIMLAERGARVEALDGDPTVLAIAQAKPGAERVRWHEGRVDALPLPDSSVDRVVCSLLLHHLSDELKLVTLGEALRVLRVGGRLHVADWGPARDPFVRLAFRFLQLLDGRESTQSHADGEVPGFIAAAGFTGVRVTSRLRTTWGQLELITATKGAGERGL